MSTAAVSIGLAVSIGWHLKYVYLCQTYGDGIAISLGILFFWIAF
jgi:hypothetical protein